MNEIKKHKKAAKKKEETIIENYQYSGEGELIQDKPSTPLIQNISNKTRYYNLANDGLNFTLIYRGSLIYDTIGKLNKIFNDLTFEDDYFTLYGQQYSYDGLCFKFKR